MLAVTVPFFVFFEPFQDGEDDSNRYLVTTQVFTNSSGTRTVVYTYDDDCGSEHSTSTDSPGYDDTIALGSLTSHTTSELVDTYTYQHGSIVYTLSSPVTWEDQTAKAQAYLDTLRDTEDMKEPFGVTGDYETSPGTFEEKTFACIFGSQSGDYSTLVPGAYFWCPRIILTPDASDYPWNGKYRLGLDYTEANQLWFYSYYGWRNGTQFTWDNTGSDATDWFVHGRQGNLICGKSCHALPDGMGCGSADVQDVVYCTIDTETDYVLTGDCFGLDLAPGWYCFGIEGIFRPGGTTAISASYSAVTAVGWMLADEDGNGQGTIIPGAPDTYGPIAWEVDCCP